jgi:hypothetical protein
MFGMVQENSLNEDIEHAMISVACNDASMRDYK